LATLQRRLGAKTLKLCCRARMRQLRSSVPEQIVTETPPEARMWGGTQVPVPLVLPKVQTRAPFRAAP